MPPLVCPWRNAWPVKPSPLMAGPFVSQCGQDVYLDTVLFGGARKGLYLDIGCNDGRSNSNTWFFNRVRGWTGTCFEADPNKFASIAMVSGRHDAIHAAVSHRDGTAAFAVVNVPDGGLSGLADTLDHARANAFGRPRSISVPTLTPQSLLQRHYPNATRALDYVSIDVEGHELEVLRNWPLGGRQWCVNVFTIENAHWCNRTEGILPQLKQIFGPSYKHVRSIGVDELFVRHQPCPTATVRLAPPPYDRRVPQYAPNVADYAWPTSTWHAPTNANVGGVSRSTAGGPMKPLPAAARAAPRPTGLGRPTFRTPTKVVTPSRSGSKPQKPSGAAPSAVRGRRRKRRHRQQR